MLDINPRKNPYALGAGTPPPELAGRDELTESASIILDRIRNGLAARSLILYGLRGVGKTVLLNRIKLDAEVAGVYCVPLEAPEERSLPAILLPALRSSLMRVNRTQATKEGIKRILGSLAAFAKAFKVKYDDIEFSVDLEPIEGIADSGDLENDLGELLGLLGRHAQQHKTVLSLFIDDLQ